MNILKKNTTKNDFRRKEEGENKPKKVKKGSRFKMNKTKCKNKRNRSSKTKKMRK